MESCQVSFLTNISLASNIIKTCQILHHHILALEFDMEVFEKMLELLVWVPIFWSKHPTMHLDVEDSPPLKYLKWNLDCE
jgi:hypothetical protein